MNSLTSLRFFAAVMVLLHHIAYVFYPLSPIEWVFGNGYVGVAFFFVLSGFVLAWVHDPSTSARQFYARRFARIYPLHLVTALAAVPILLVLGAPISSGTTIANLLLAHAWVPMDQWDSSLNGASWSLSCEAFFYALFPVLVVLAIRGGFKRIAALTAVYLITAAVIVLATAPDGVAAELLYKGPWFRIGEFMLGIAVAVAVRRGYRSRISLPVAIGITAILYSAISAGTVALGMQGTAVPRVLVDLLVLPIACLLVAAAATADLAGRTGVLTSPVLIRLGEASFALYMVHYLLLQLWGRLPVAALPTWLSASLVALVAIALSLLAHRYVERPAERFLRGRLTRSRSSTRLSVDAIAVGGAR